MKNYGLVSVLCYTYFNTSVSNTRCHTLTTMNVHRCHSDFMRWQQE